VRLIVMNQNDKLSALLLFVIGSLASVGLYQAVSLASQYPSVPALFGISGLILTALLSGVLYRYPLQGFTLMRQADIDIAERGQIRSHLENHRPSQLSGSLFRAMVEQPLVGIFIQQDSRLSYVNPALVRMFGFDQAEAMMAWFDNGFIASPLPGETLKSDEHSVRQVRIMHRNGHWIDAEIHTHYITVDNEVQLMGFVLDITERIADAKRHEEATQRLQMTIQSGSIGLWEWNTETNRVYFSPEWKKQLGYAASEISDSFHEWQERIHPEDIEPTLHIVNDYLEHCPGSGYQAEFRMQHKDGSYRWILSRGTLMLQGGQARQRIMLGTHIDITAQKAREQAIQLLEERHRFALETLNVGEWESNRDTGEMTRSPIHDRIFGYDPPLARWSIDLFLEHVLPEDRVQVQQAMDHIRRKKGTHDTRCRIRRADGEIRWIYGRARIRVDTDGHEMVAGVIMDITDQHRTAQALRDSEARLALFIEHAPVALAMFDRTMCYLAASRRWYEDYRLDQPSITGVCHYDLFPDMPTAWPVAHQQGLSGQPVSCAEELYVNAHGEQQWLSWAIHPWYTDTGEVGGIILFTSDITERKLSQILLQESETRFRSLFEHLPVAYQSLDIQGNWLDANDKMAELLGFDSARELLGQDFSRFWQEGFCDSFSENYERFKARNKVEGEIRLIRRDGVPLTVLVAGRIQRDVHGQFLRTHCVVMDVTAHRRMEDNIRELNANLERKVEERTEALRESELKARRIIACSPVAMLLVREDGYIEMANQKAGELLRCDPDALGQRLVDDFVPENSRARHRRSRLGFTENLNREPVYLDQGIKALASDGTEIPVEIGLGSTLIGQTCYTIASLLDITQRVMTEQRIQTTLRRLSLATEAAEIGIWIWNFTDDSLEWDERMVALYEPPTNIHQTGLYYDAWHSRLHPEERDEIARRLWFARNSLTEWRDDFRLLFPDGRIRYIHAAAVVEADACGQPVRMIGINRDITHQRLFEQTLLEAREQAESANRAKGEFLANVSHDIRTPMNAIIGLTALTLNSELNPRQRDYLTKVDRAARALLRLLNDILDYSRIEAGFVELESRAFELADVIKTVADLYSDQMKGKGLDWQVALDPCLPRYLRGDALRFNQILSNLIGNALKFTEQGRVGLSIERLSADTDAGVMIRIRVTDTGIGIAPEQQLRLFSSFEQADASTTRKYGGTGLGLAITRRLTELMGGQIEVQSAPEQGSTFTVTLPFVIPVATEVPNTLPSSGDLNELARPIHGMRILVVDDQENNRLLVSDWLKEAGLLVAEADSGDEALALLCHQRYAAVLMDVQMPGMDGYQTTAKILKRQGGSAPPVIALTAMAMAGDRQACLDAGMVDHLTKPIDPVLLINALRRWIKPVDTDPQQHLTPLNTLTGEQKADMEIHLTQLEQQLANNQFSARRTAEYIETLLHQTRDANAFQPVMEATRKLQTREALAALIAFNRQRIG